MSVATLGRINLAGLVKKPEKSKTEYPTIETDRAKQLAEVILQLAEEEEAVKANLEINKAELRSLVIPEFFRRFAGRKEVPSSMAVHAPDGREVLVTMTSRYKQPTDAAALTAILGEQNTERYLCSSFELKIDSTKIPQDKQQDVVNSVVELFTLFGCADAISARESVAPTEDFHVARHTLFDEEKNMAIENIMPMTVAVKTKGRK